MKKGGALLVLLMPLCCALPILIISGALAGVGAWFTDGPGLALVAAAGVAIIVYVLWRRYKSSRSEKVRRPAVTERDLP